MKTKLLFWLQGLLATAVLAAERVEVIGYRASTTTPVSFENINIHDSSIPNTSIEPSFYLNEAVGITNYSDSGSYQGYSYIRMRGMGQTRINMTLDGVPLNEPEDQGVYFSNYPGIFGALEGIQVQRGVGTSQNGTASFAGSLQLRSIDLSRERTTTLEAGAASFNTKNIAVSHLSGLEELNRANAGYFVQLTHVDSDGYKHHSGNTSGSAFLSGMLEDASGYWKLTGFSGTQSNELAWIGVSQEEIDRDPRSNGNARENDRFDQSLIYLSRLIKINAHFTSETTMYGNALDGNYDFDLNNYLGLPSSNELYNYAFDSEFFGLFSTIDYQADNLTTSFGIHLNDYQRKHMGSEKTLGELFANTGHKGSQSVNASLSYGVAAFNLFADVQYRRTDFRYDGSVSMKDFEWSFVNPRIGITYQASNTTYYYSVGKTGREPTRSDLFGGNENLELDESGSPALFVVKPEYAVDHELGVRFQSGSLNGSGNVYYMRFSDEITLNGQIGPNGLPLNKSVDKSVRSGIELLANYALTDSFNIRSMATLSHNEISQDRQRFSPILTPERILGVSMHYDLGGIQLGANVRYRGKSFLNLANTEIIQSYVVAGLSASWAIKNLAANLQVNNIFNESYNSSGSIGIDGEPKYFIGVPRSVALTLRLAF